ncbi:hypothetical protein TST_0743 [Thermosulfidibacter takaii ABI70S6]|uniref:Uncharacterized protein n=1 Tax=Thermosulfidibacter takaii (strain DSM 17441 / JCM 13301 / NBRC 103674 / ABI70S6) TaxID=1298851 RepID=A0A0S3QTC0_THET7|nr:hypothetical protein TST_0743 [Thermosulfidibacter takaii ABI70S6]
MFKKMCLNLLIFVGFFLAVTSAWAGRCGPPSSSSYNAQTDSYIVIEGEISGLPSSYYVATPVIPLPFSPPSTCSIRFVTGYQRPYRPYYCQYFIFKDTTTKRECWDYFKNLSSVNLRVTHIRVTKTRGSQPENWDANPSSRTVTLGPVHQTR